jgi:hypothetical protein
MEHGSPRLPTLVPDFASASLLRIYCRELDTSVASPRKGASSAVTLNCGIGSRFLNALVNALDKLHNVRGANSSTRGLK